MKAEARTPLFSVWQTFGRLRSLVRAVPKGNLIVLAASLLALLAALWAGWIRLGWAFPALQASLPVSHGPLMVSGFLGTLISLERAVALRQRWTYIGPALSGLGGLALVVGVPGLLGPVLLTLGSVGLVAIFAAILRQRRTADTVVMALGAASWLVGNLLWLSGRAVFEVVLWWAAFLILTVAGERLELGRLRRLSPTVEALFAAATLLFLAGVGLSAFQLVTGTRLAAAGMLALAAWLLRYDIARLTIRKPGLPRYAAACLLSGYVWLGAAGVMGLVFGALPAGPRYDAFLHAVFLGFIFAMIFGHAPIIFPAVLGRPVSFSPVFYIHLALLHLSLLLRVGGDLAGFWPARLWGGMLNGITLLVFLGLTARAVMRKGPTG